MIFKKFVRKLKNSKLIKARLTEDKETERSLLARDDLGLQTDIGKESDHPLKVIWDEGIRDYDSRTTAGEEDIQVMKAEISQGKHRAKSANKSSIKTAGITRRVKTAPPYRCRQTASRSNSKGNDSTSHVIDAVFKAQRDTCHSPSRDVPKQLFLTDDPYKEKCPIDSSRQKSSRGINQRKSISFATRPITAPQVQKCSLDLLEDEFERQLTIVERRTKPHLQKARPKTAVDRRVMADKSQYRSGSSVDDDSTQSNWSADLDSTSNCKDDIYTVIKLQRPKTGRVTRPTELNSFSTLTSSVSEIERAESLDASSLSDDIPELELGQRRPKTAANGYQNSGNRPKTAMCGSNTAIEKSDDGISNCPKTSKVRIRPKTSIIRQTSFESYQPSKPASTRPKTAYFKLETSTSLTRQRMQNLQPQGSRPKTAHIKFETSTSPTRQPTPILQPPGSRPKTAGNIQNSHLGVSRTVGRAHSAPARRHSARRMSIWTEEPTVQPSLMEMHQAAVAEADYENKMKAFIKTIEPDKAEHDCTNVIDYYAQRLHENTCFKPAQLKIWLRPDTYSQVVTEHKPAPSLTHKKLNFDFTECTVD